MPSVMPVENAASRSAFDAYLIEVVTFVIPLVSWNVTVMIDWLTPHGNAQVARIEDLRMHDSSRAERPPEPLP